MCRVLTKVILCDIIGSMTKRIRQLAVCCIAVFCVLAFAGCPPSEPGTALTRDEVVRFLRYSHNIEIQEWTGESFVNVWQIADMLDIPNNMRVRWEASYAHHGYDIIIASTIMTTDGEELLVVYPRIVGIFDGLRDVDSIGLVDLRNYILVARNPFSWGYQDFVRAVNEIEDADVRAELLSRLSSNLYMTRLSGENIWEHGLSEYERTALNQILVYRQAVRLVRSDGFVDISVQYHLLLIRRGNDMTVAILESRFWLSGRDRHRAVRIIHPYNMSVSEFVDMISGINESGYPYCDGGVCADDCQCYGPEDCYCELGGYGYDQ